MSGVSAPQWYGVGGDYMYSYTQNLPIETALERWAEEIPMMLYMGYNTIRLAFSFWDGDTHSKLVYSDMDQVLDLFDGYGMKAILDLHNWQHHCMQTRFGTQGWREAWAYAAEYYRDDDRVIAYEVFNEPENADADGLKLCLDVIRVEDPDKIVVYPDPWFWRTTAQIWDPQTALQYADDNVVVSSHDWASAWSACDPPYDQGNGYTGCLPAFYDSRVARLNVWRQHFKMWMGEINFWCASGYGFTYPDFLRDMINAFVGVGAGFNLWMHGAPSAVGGRAGAWEVDNRIVSEVFNGGEVLSLPYTNTDNEKAIYKFVVKEMVETIVSERTVEVQPGERIVLTWEEGEEMVRVE